MSQTPPRTPSSATAAPQESTSSEISGQDPNFKLQSLAPKYDASQHASYVRHLEEAIADPKNKNIALTGRYGSGKSSILDEFIKRQEQNSISTLRMSISTLGPDGDDDITNKIQKELVKQLVYRAAPGEIRRSRFVRTKELTSQKALLEAFGVGVLVVGLLTLFGIWPTENALEDVPVAVTSLVLLVLIVGGAWAIRWIIGNRLVSLFSTGGASISLEERPDSYFDEYLDEIVAFFETQEPDLVIFEDLDRFDDPRIFDALRELNTLINSSAHWQERKEKPLRFIYAIKDSLFEKLGEDHRRSASKNKESGSSEGSHDDKEANDLVTQQDRGGGDAAIERANRTKFFEIVIPVVPFLSHSNARDLLVKTLRDLEMPQSTDISRELLDLVARHTSDMRLLINVCNEFVVYAERLLWIQHPAPRMTADHLFALVVYKNFHLKDFEALPHRGSALDRLEVIRRELVHESIKSLQQEKRNLLRWGYLPQERDRVARILGERLMTWLQVTKHELQHIQGDNQSFKSEAIYESEFWKHVAETKKLSVGTRMSNRGTINVSFGVKQLKALFPEVVEPVRWSELGDEDLEERLARLNQDVAALRGAGFAELAKDSRFTLDGLTFEDHLRKTLHSNMAQDLVRRGFVDRYYAEYSTIFYGEFLGVDVANYFRHCIWPNEIDVYFQFHSEQALQNLLEQAPEDFTSSRSVLNIQIVNYILEHRPEIAKKVVRSMVTEFESDTDNFLQAFFSSEESKKRELVCLLAAHPWRELFNFLTLSDSIPSDDLRTELLDVALLNAWDAESYDLDESFHSLLEERHLRLRAFIESLSSNELDVVLSFIRQTGLTVSFLRKLSEDLGQSVVEEGLFSLNGDNLRVALGISKTESFELERIRANEAVWQRCTEDVDAYFKAVDKDPHTPYAVETYEALNETITEHQESWSRAELERLVFLSAPEASVPQLSELPDTVWPHLVDARRMRPSLDNLNAYISVYGLDEHLARFLVDTLGGHEDIEGLEDAEPEAILGLAIKILNASKTLKVTDRVFYALQLDAAANFGSVKATEIQPVGDDLFAALLEAELVSDTAESFEHFSKAGWRAVSNALVVSEQAAEFLTPELVAGHASDLLRNPKIPLATKSEVVANLGDYVADDDKHALREAALCAYQNKIELSFRQIERVAPYVTNPEHVVWQLACSIEELDGLDALRVLSKLGGDFSGFQYESGHKFELHVTENLELVLKQLSTSGLIELQEGKRSGHKRVELR